MIEKSEFLRRVGRRLRLMRRLKNISQAEFGRRCKPPVTHAQVSRWEAGKAEVSVSRMADWCEAFGGGFMPGYFIGEIPDGQTEEEFAAAVVETARKTQEIIERGELNQLVTPKRIEPGGRFYDPDAAPVPAGIRELLDAGVPMTLAELRKLQAYADPMSDRPGARGAMAWTAREWYEVLLEERKQEALRRLEEGGALTASELELRPTDGDGDESGRHARESG